MPRIDTAFYPPIEASNSGMLEVDETHTLYWEAFGNPAGPPVLILHGGPGGGIRPYYRQLIDPAHFRGILFEQRGCGRSTPSGELRANTTQDLVSDMEKLRAHLDIGRWLVIGGSWGSTLALAYAQAHRQSCAGLIVSGVFLARDIDAWWWWEGTRFVYPEVWAEFNAFLPIGERDDLRRSYIRRVLDPDPDIHKPAAISLMTYEAQTLDVWPDMAFIQDIEVSEHSVTMGRIFAHYDESCYFVEEGQLLNNASRLSSIPGTIINGRFDMCTPPHGAYDLHQVWPQAQLKIVPVAGHRWNDESLGSALVAATDGFRAISWF